MIARFLLGAVAAAGTLASAGPAAQAERPAAVQHVVLAGIPGLQWSDVSAAATPALYRLAEHGAVGTVVEHAVLPHACPADGWLTLNSGTRAGMRHTQSGPCPRLPAVTGQTITGWRDIIAYNDTLNYGPYWGALNSGLSCDLAVGPGAALALADGSGHVARYLPSAGEVTAADLARCPLTVIDLGALPASGRAAAVHAADAELGRIAAELPPDTAMLVTAPGADGRAQLGVIVAYGYGAGMLNASSTRQPGLIVSTDVTSTVRAWLGQPAGVGGTVVTAGSRGSLDAAIRGFTAMQTAEQVWTSTHSWFFWAYALADAGVLAAIGLAFWGATALARRRRAAWWRVACVFAVAMPAGTFLANLVPWSRMDHPAAWLYGTSLLIGLAFGAAALVAGRTERLREDPLAPFGLVCLVTLLVLGVDVMTGSRLQLQTPFGLSVLEAGRFYGIGNEALGIYGMAALAGAGWLALRLRRTHGRGAAVIAVAAVGVFAVFASGWPGFGGKAGGTITLVPCFLLLGGAVAGTRLTWRRALLAAVSGLAVLAVFALVNYLVPATGSSDIGHFAGDVLHGRQAGGNLLIRKIHSNIGSLSVNAFSPLIPLVLLITGLMLWRPSWFRLASLSRARAVLPLLTCLWLAGLLGWFANDSGIIVPAAAMPFGLPLGIGIITTVAAVTDNGEPRYRGTAHPASAAGQPALRLVSHCRSTNCRVSSPARSCAPSGGRGPTAQRTSRLSAVRSSPPTTCPRSTRCTCRFLWTGR